jgi:hypothetical protein
MAGAEGANGRVQRGLRRRICTLTTVMSCLAGLCIIASVMEVLQSLGTVSFCRFERSTEL